MQRQPAFFLFIDKCCSNVDVTAGYSGNNIVMTTEYSGNIAVAASV